MITQFGCFSLTSGYPALTLATGTQLTKLNKTHLGEELHYAKAHMENTEKEAEPFRSQFLEAGEESCGEAVITRS